MDKFIEARKYIFRHTSRAVEKKLFLLVSFLFAVNLFWFVFALTAAYLLLPAEKVLGFTVVSAAVILLWLVLAAVSFSIIYAFFRERDRARTVLANLYDGLIEYDENNKIIFFNPRAEEMLGVRREEVLEKIVEPALVQDPHFKLLVQVFFPAEGAAMRLVVSESVKDKPYKIHEFSQKEPVELDWQVITVPVFDGEGRLISFLKILRDISREKAVSRKMSEFISITAHQMQTPLSAVRWMFKMLIGGDIGQLTEEQKTFISKNSEAVEIMIELVNDLLSVSKMESGRFGYDFVKTDIVDLAAKIVDGLQFKAKGKGVSLIFEKPAVVLPEITIDPQKIKMALGNLADNAVKYTLAGGRVLVAIEDKEPYLEISVRDSGIGIPKHQINRLFTKFFRGDNAVHLQTEGTGLGLFIVKNIIERHGGEIKVESEEGKGSVFRFTLPKKESMLPKG